MSNIQSSEPLLLSKNIHLFRLRGQCIVDNDSRIFVICGNSMDNGLKESIPDGSVLACQSIDSSLWERVIEGGIGNDLVLTGACTDAGAACVTRIIEYRTQEAVLVCSSLNSDKIRYPNHEIRLSDLTAIYSIVSVTTYKPSKNDEF